MKLMIRKMLRRILRLILFALSRWTIRKHRPTIIAIVGEGETGIVREAIYAVLKNHLPVRRNLEPPSAEFVLPLTILGTQEYPTAFWRWVAILARSVGQLLLLPPHRHTLILEIGYTRKETFDYFWRITQPQILVICGRAPYLSKEQTAPKVITVKPTPNLNGSFTAALQVGEALGISRKEGEKALTDFTLPKARIRILPTKSGGLVIDATYQYFPPEPEALNEILEAIPGKKTILSPRNLPKEAPKIKGGRVAVLTGPAKKMWPLLLELTKTPWAE
ncbi:MAG: hypothetical protein BMS9Abin34_078 [Patescibacteria group bacterium]|nr:MAG: hypothetical protein BMS9Abin34_078 [Patescibacteria group bacterium]